MKILVLQLARLGDIWMSAPSINALKRIYPDAELHVLVKSRFRGAIELCDCVDRILELPNREILQTLIEHEDLNPTFDRLDTFLKSIRENNYDKIINLSYSPLSSFLASAFATEQTELLGYQRHEDGFLALKDDTSRFFMAQVGPGKFNRWHLIDLLASTCKVDLKDEDFRVKKNNENLSKLFWKDYIVLHLGASEEHKKVSNQDWHDLVYHLRINLPEFQIVLIGSAAEEEDAIKITSMLTMGRILNLVGQTSLKQLVPIFMGARLLLGSDSGPIHLARLCRTPVLNLSLGEVNFWETGPKGKGSFVLSYARRIHLEEVIKTASQILKGLRVEQGYIGTDTLPSFIAINQSISEEHEFAWQLINTIYLGEPYPIANDLEFTKSIQDLIAVNDLALSMMAQKQRVDFIGKYLDRVYETMNAIAQSNTIVGIFVNWIKAEKCKVEPGLPHEIVEDYFKIHSDLEKILNPYRIENKTYKSGESCGKI